MIHIYTRENKRGKWWCNGTINGYDHSFEAITPPMAQQLMIMLLRKTNVDMEGIRWHVIEYYSKSVHEVLIKSQTTRLSH